MNGLTLRIIRGGTTKSKNSIGFPPIRVPNSLKFSLGEGFSGGADYIEIFTNASSTDEQLSVLRNVLNEPSNIDSRLFMFLAVVFLLGEAKHPVKCFVTRHITKTENLQQPFAEALAEQIKLQIVNKPSTYLDYITVVSRLAMCIENFPAGAFAIKSVEVDLAEYMVNCLECCIHTLSEQKTLSPTERNEVFNLAHLSLRLLLYIVQKVTDENTANLRSMFKEIKLYIKQLLFDDDVPMDTKTVCGILLLSMHIMENGSDSWLDILNETNSELNAVMSQAAGRLALQSALGTFLSSGRLALDTDHGQPAVLALARDAVRGAQRNCSDSAYTLGVTRTLVQISKTLNKITDNDVELGLIYCLLPFVWGHLEHYMDSVRHLTAQLLDNIVKHCTRLHREGNDEALSSLFAALSSLDKHRKSYYVTVTSLCNALGAARLMERVPDVIGDVMDGLHVQAVQASATTTLETLLQKHTRESNPRTIYEQWILPILGQVGSHGDSTVLSILEQMMASAVVVDDRLMDYILPHIKSSCDNTHPHDLKCVLMLVSVAKRARLTSSAGGASDTGDLWKGIIGYDVLKRAAVDGNDEIRILSLSLVVESSKTTEVFAAGELDLVLWFLKYNINAQSPNFRQLTLSLMKKFMKRLEDSFKVLKRQKEPNDAVNRVQYYSKFVEDLRATCYSSLLRGANYSRRFVALQVLQWSSRMALEGVDSMWTEDYVEKLLLHLEDSYENNKALALDILGECPDELLKGKKYSVSLELEDILREASSLKPTDCVSAAYKLNFLRKKLPEHILQGHQCTAAEPVMFSLFSRLLSSLKAELSVAQSSIACAARQGPMYGLLHCLRQLVQYVDVGAICEDEQWHSLISEVISTCTAVCSAVSPVVNNASPEGHLPMDGTSVGVHDRGNDGGLVLDDGRPVTAQMVLLCAWRSVKEVSLLLGELSSRLTVRSETSEGVGSLTVDQLIHIGEHFTTLLAETKHRGAFEQAYVGFTKLLARLWRSRCCQLHSLPRRWLACLMDDIAAPRRKGLCATRRGAGLPFMIQALVTTELQVEGNPKCFHQTMATLLRLASPPSLIKYRSKLSYSAKNNINSISNYSSDDIEQESYSNHTNIEQESYSNHTNIQESHNNDTIISPKSDISQESDSNRKENLIQNDNVQESYSKNAENSIQDNNIEQSHNNINNSTDHSQESHSDELETRIHSLNILRALFRNSALDESVAGYVADGIMVAISGFEGDTWAERNASTLAFSALMTRVFGAARSRDQDRLHVRNKMTGRIFFLRYPQLYDFMLAKLEEDLVSVGSPRPCTGPLLSVVGRLYPSALEGCRSSLRLAAFLPAVRAHAARPALAARRRAAHAAGPLLHPLEYAPHLESLLTILSDPNIRRNYCHGILLQLTHLLASRPPCLDLDTYNARLVACLGSTKWVLEQAVGDRPCYLIADEYVKMINLILWWFPSLITQEFIDNIENYIQKLLYETKAPSISFGREVCLSNALYLHFIILTKYNHEKIEQFVYKGLLHDAYDVVLATLNYLLILHKSLEVENKFQKHLILLLNHNVLTKLSENIDYIEILCDILKNNRYLECTQKALKVLTLEKDTQKYIVQVKTKIDDISDEIIIRKLIDLIQIEHENITHIYLESLSRFVTQKLKDSSISKEIILEVLRTMFACSSSDNGEDTRGVVVSFLERNFEVLFNMDLGELSHESRFEFKATLLATTVMLLEDDDETLRQRISNVITVTSSPVLPCKAAETIRESAESDDDNTALFVVLALLDFKCEVCVTDEISDECRVFDQNERYNIFLEETVWTNECAEKILRLHQGSNNVLEIVQSVIEYDPYRGTIDKLCNNNVTMFKKIIQGHIMTNSDAINPKLELFVNKLKNKYVLR